VTAVESLSEMVLTLSHILYVLIMSVGVGLVAVTALNRLFLADYLGQLEKTNKLYGHEKLVNQVISLAVMTLSFAYFADAGVATFVAMCGASYMVAERSIFGWLALAIPESKLAGVKIALSGAVLFLLSAVFNEGSVSAIFSLIFLIAAALLLLSPAPDQGQEK